MQTTTEAAEGPLPERTQRLLEEQLGRMRGLQFAYYDQFFRFLNLSLVTLIFAAVAALAFNDRVALLLPFWVIFIGFHSSYLFSYVTLARTYATAIEQRLNRANDGHWLVAHELEAAYVFPISRPRFVAWSPVNRASWLSAETAMFTGGLGLAWLVTTAWGLKVSWEANPAWALIFAVLLFVWSAGCMGFVWWYHFRSDYEARLRRILEARYGIGYVDRDGKPL